ATALATFASFLHQSKFSACREHLAREAVARAPKELWPRAFLGAVVLERLNADGDPTCAADRRLDCERELESHARAIETEHPQAFAGTRLRAELLRSRHEYDRAERLLADR